LKCAVITVVENAGVGQSPIACFVGHKAGTMAGDTYSAGMAEKVTLEVAQKVRYAKAVEDLVRPSDATLAR